MAGFVLLFALVGTLFLTAMVASLVGGGLVESAVFSPHDLAAVAENETQWRSAPASSRC